MCLFAMPAFFVGMGAPAMAGGMSAASVMMAASLAATVASTTIGAVGASKRADYEAEMAKRNQKLAEMKAEDAIKRGKEKESAHRLKVLSIASSQEAYMASHGLDISSGTPSLILEDTYTLGEIDAATIRRDAAREAWGYEMAAGDAAAQAELALQAGSWNTAGTVLSGAGRIADRWYTYTSSDDEGELPSLWG